MEDIPTPAEMASAARMSFDELAAEALAVKQAS
jgi:hypothetical protein